MAVAKSNATTIDVRIMPIRRDTYRLAAAIMGTSPCFSDSLQIPLVPPRGMERFDVKRGLMKKIGEEGGLSALASKFFDNVEKRSYMPFPHHMA